jgi:DNA-binding beta-propeller fold protein YncE
LPQTKRIVSISVILLVIGLIAVSIFLGADLFLFKTSGVTTATSTAVLTTQITLIAPTTATVTDTTSLTKTVLLTTTLQGIIPPINNVLVSNISLPQYTWGVTVDSNSDLVYAIAPQSNLTVINGTTNRIVASLSVGAYGSDYVAVDPVSNLIYSGNSIVNGSDDKVIGQFPDNITDLAVNSRTDTLFALSSDGAPGGNTTLLIFNGTGNSLKARIEINGSADTLAINPVTNTVYIPVCSTGNVCSPIYLVALNGSNFRTTSRILVDSSETSGIPFAIAVNSETNMIYLTDQELISINGSSDTVAAETIVSAFTIQCRGLAVNEATNEIYVVGWGVGDYGSFFIVNGQNYSLLNAFAGTGEPVGVSYNPANSEIYVANSETRSVFVLNSTAFVVP